MNPSYELNKTVWAKVGVSKVDGVGVIAIRDIPKGQKLYLTDKTDGWFTGSLIGVHPAIEKIILQRWPLTHMPFQSPNADARLTSFLNHSPKPNYDFKTDRAVRDIKEGEEITECYPQNLVSEKW